MLNWNHSIPAENTFTLLSTFILEIIEPCLVWSAGRSKEAIRAMATQALCSIGDACPQQAAAIFSKLSKHFLVLTEDGLAITRAYAIRCALKAGPLQYVDYRDLAFSKLKIFI